LSFAFAASFACKGEVSEDLAKLGVPYLLSNPAGGNGTACTTCKIYEATNSLAGYSMNLGGISGADAVCNSDADKPSGGGTYKAFMVDGVNRIASVTANAGDGQVDWVLHANTTYYRADGTTVIGSTGSTSLFNFPLSIAANPFNIVSTGYFTGMNAANDWTSSADNCSAWASNSAGVNGTVSDGSSHAGILTAGSVTVACNNLSTIICVEQ